MSTFNVRVQYESGVTVSHNGVSYYAGKPAPDLAAEPLVENRTGFGWVPFWTNASAPSFSVGHHVARASLSGIVVIYRAWTSDNLTVEPTPRNTSGLGWVPIQQERQVVPLGVSPRPSDCFITFDGFLARVWDPAASYVRGDVALYQGVAYGTIVAQSGGAPPSMQGALSTSNWMPLWRPDVHYAQGQLVAVKSLATGLRGFAIHNDAANAGPQDMSWVPVWSPYVEYAPGAFSKDTVDGTVYFLVTATHSMAPRSDARDLRGWVPVWTPTDTYLKGVYVYHQNTLYVCSGDDLTTGEPILDAESGLTGVEPSMSIPNQWIAVWKQDAAYQSGQYVSHMGERFVALVPVASNIVPSPANTNTAYWIRVWAPQTSYTAGCAVSHNVRVYMAVTDITVNVKPQTENTWGHGWVPLHLDGIDYPLGVHVYKKGTVFGTRVAQLANNSPDAPDLTNPLSTSSDGWVRAWQPRTVYPRGSVVFYRGDVYLAMAVPAPSEHPYRGSNVWIPAWRAADGVSYPTASLVVCETDGAAVISTSSPLFVLRSDPGAAPPASGNMTGEGWVLVWQADDTIEFRDGEWVYWAGDFYKWQPGGVFTGVDPDPAVGPTATPQEVRLVSASGWSSDAAYNDGAYAGSKATTIFDAPPRNGEWLQVSVRSPAVVTRYVMQAAQAVEEAPRDFDLLGSVNGAVWHTIDSNEGVVWTQGTLEFTPTPERTAPYTFFRLVTREVGNLEPKGATRASLGGLTIYGRYTYMNAPLSSLNTGAIDVRSDDTAPPNKKRWFQNGDELDFVEPTLGKQAMLAPIWVDGMTSCGSVGVDENGCVYALYQYTDGTQPVVRNADGTEAGNVTLPLTEAPVTTSTGTCALTKYAADGAAEWAATVNSIDAIRCSATARTGTTLLVASYKEGACIGGVDLRLEDNTLFAFIDAYGALVDFWTANCAGKCAAAAAYSADGSVAYMAVDDCNPVFTRRNGMDVYSAAARGTQVLRFEQTGGGVCMVQWSASILDASGAAPPSVTDAIISYSALALNARNGTICIGGVRGQQMQVMEPGRTARPWLSQKFTWTSTASVLVLHEETGAVLDEVTISQAAALDSHRDAVTALSCDGQGNMAVACAVVATDLSKVTIGEAGGKASKVLLPRLTSPVSWHITVSYNASLRAIWATYLASAGFARAFCKYAQDGALYLSGSGCTGMLGGTYVPLSAPPQDATQVLDPTKSYVARITSDGLCDLVLAGSHQPDPVLGSSQLFEDRSGRLYGVGVTRTGADTITGKTFSASYTSPASVTGSGGGSFILRININNPYRLVPADDQATHAVLNNKGQGLVNVLLQDPQDAVTRRTCILEPGQTLTIPSRAPPPQAPATAP
ncbi:hypothetical protein HXX76_014183 [Chlamydomonas incerta]|uniref:Chitin-binding type-3 domain-containing protein n=1 Tax=Chlamydomonas incerta TaxID=51695 RepID=A0A835SQM7_CHLIN|nr:hypothetical protein HXX76_014183 [Chlamydomonas incerta]|eukprot:KAG2425025.1 hypothetical protein HXX76_014183 [Chlamydomonas incerta]